MAPHRRGATPTPEQMQAEADSAGLNWLVGSRAVLAVVEMGGNAVVGRISLRRCGLPGMGEIDLSVHPAWRGRGFAARALRLLSGWALADGGFDRLGIGVDPANVAAVNVARAGGFSERAVLSQWTRNDDGTFTDEIWFARPR